MKKYTLYIFLFFLTVNIFSQELIIGEERIEPGIVLIFEGAIKDEVFPKNNNLKINETNIHIEARVNWDSTNIPAGTPAGGFIPYMRLNSKIINSTTGLSTFIDLLPHINLIDNFHYARNISLPGNIDDKYDVIFNVIPPSDYELNLHKDWSQQYGNGLFESQTFQYLGIDFKDIAQAERN